MKIKCLLLFILQITLTNISYGQANNEIFNLYKNYRFEEAVNKLNSLNSLNEENKFLKIKILACIGKLDEVNTLKKKLLTNIKSTSLKKEAEFYFKQIDYYLNPHKNPIIEVNGAKAEAYNHLASEGITPISFFDDKKNPNRPYSRALINSSGKVILKQEIPAIIGTTHFSDFHNGISFVQEGFYLGLSSKTKIINKQGTILYECERCAPNKPEFDNNQVTIWKAIKTTIKGEFYNVKIPHVIDDNNNILYNKESPFIPEEYNNGISVAGPLWVGECGIPIPKFLCSEIMSVALMDSQGNIIVDYREKGWENIFLYGFEYGNYSQFWATINGVEKVGFIDRKGKIIFQKNSSWFSFEEFNFDSSELIRYQNRDIQKYGYLDRQGNIEIPAKFNNNQPFYNNLAAVQVDIKEGQEYTWGYINPKGDFISKIIYEKADPFIDNKSAQIQFKGKKYLINTKFEPLICYSKTEENKISDESLASQFRYFWLENSEVEYDILEYYGAGRNDSNKIKLLSKFFNEKGKYLTQELEGGDDSDFYCYENKKINWLNFMLYESHIGELQLFVENKLNIDWNIYDIVNGNKFTILDFIDCILGNEEDVEMFNLDDLKRLKRDLIYYVGAKYGKEL